MKTALNLCVCPLLLSMLAGCATEAVEGVLSDVVAALYRDFLDRIGHVLDGNTQESLGNSLRRDVLTPDL